MSTVRNTCDHSSLDFMHPLNEDLSSILFNNSTDSGFLGFTRFEVKMWTVLLLIVGLAIIVGRFSCRKYLRLKQNYDEILKKNAELLSQRDRLLVDQSRNSCIGKTEQSKVSEDSATNFKVKKEDMPQWASGNKRRSLQNDPSHVLKDNDRSQSYSQDQDSFRSSHDNHKNACSATS